MVCECLDKTTVLLTAYTCIGMHTHVVNGLLAFCIIMLSTVHVIINHTRNVSEVMIMGGE